MGNVKPEYVPDDAWKATGLPEKAARAAIAAALNAWPKSEFVETSSGLISRSRTWLANELPIIILPLGDDK